jgi:hypothetical protein
MERLLFERLILPTVQDECVRHLISAAMKREEEIDFIESYYPPPPPTQKKEKEKRDPV